MLATCCRAGGVDGRRSQGLTARLLLLRLLRLLRADMPGWRRTLAEVLQLRKPVVVSMYCEHEGHKMTRQLNWVEQEFSEAAFQQCDRIVRHWFAAHAEQHIAEAGQGTPPDDVRHTIGPVHIGEHALRRTRYFMHPMIHTRTHHIPTALALLRVPCIIALRRVRGRPIFSGGSHPTPTRTHHPGTATMLRHTGCGTASGWPSLVHVLPTTRLQTCAAGGSSRASFSSLGFSSVMKLIIVSGRINK
jgi:hypothetical protein